MEIKTAIVTGGAGFIGVNLIQRLINEYEKIICVDNFSLGNRNYLKFEDPIKKNQIEIIDLDLSDLIETKKLFNKFYEKNFYGDVWHLAANSDIPAGVENSNVDFKDTFSTTFNILSAMKESKFKKIYFASSSAIYGDHQNKRLNENSGPLLPISNYGAMKLSSEAVISAAAESYLERAVIFRFPNVVGAPATHGVIFDFINKLVNNAGKLDVLGDGSQRKSYLHVSDLVSGMIEVSKKWIDNKKIDIYNLGPTDDGIYVKEIAEIVCENFKNKTEIIYGSQKRGWVGDVPKFFYDTNKIQKEVGWTPSMNSKDAIQKASSEIFDQILSQ